MSKLIRIFLICMVLAFCSHCNSKYNRLSLDYTRKERFFRFFLMLSMILFVGLRTDYNDTYTYKLIYEAIPADIGLFEGINWLKLGTNPGFTFTNRLLVHLGFSTQSFLMFYAVVTMSIYVWFIHKYTCNIWFSFFLMFTMGVFTFPLAAIKQCVAVAFCVLATDYAIRRKYVSFTFFVLVGSLFHPYALMYLVVPFIFFRPWSSMTYVMLVAFALIGFFLESLLGTVLNLTDILGEGFTAESFSGEGINPFRLIVHAVPVFVAFLLRPSLEQRNDRANNLITNLTMLNAEIMFVALFGTANYFGRLANYFQIFQVVSLPWLFTHFGEKSRRFITVSACSCYFLYFIYTYSLHTLFDPDYRAITLWEYLLSVVN